MLAPITESNLINFFSMIAEPVRYSILRFLLKEKKLSVSEIIKKTERSQTMISYHLRCLKDCGLLNSTKANEDARVIYYSLHDPEFVERLFLIAENFLLKHEACKDHPACRLQS